MYIRTEIDERDTYTMLGLGDVVTTSRTDDAVSGASLIFSFIEWGFVGPVYIQPG